MLRVWLKVKVLHLSEVLHRTLSIAIALHYNEGMYNTHVHHTLISVQWNETCAGAQGHVKCLLCFSHFLFPLVHFSTQDFIEELYMYIVA